MSHNGQPNAIFESESDDSGDESDESPSAWQLLARAAAESYGMPEPRTAQSIDRAIQRLFGTSNFRFSQTPVIDTSSFPDYQLTQMEIDSGMQCTICLGSISEENHRIIRLDCSHMFHRACITPWLEQRTTCPVCRYDITDEATDRDLGDRDAARAEDVENEYELWVARLLARAISPLLDLSGNTGMRRTPGSMSMSQPPSHERDSGTQTQRPSHRDSTPQEVSNSVASSYVPKVPFSKFSMNCTSNPYAISPCGPVRNTPETTSDTQQLNGRMRGPTACGAMSSKLPGHNISQHDTITDDRKQRRERISQAAVQRQRNEKEQRVNSQMLSPHLSTNGEEQSMESASAPPPSSATDLDLD
eukprot:m.419124 g.419124  ORF g.419124 m.419124 type:complete len:360 (-) comp21300_c0_seq2:2057-3136(-)